MKYEPPSSERRQHTRVNARGPVILRGCGREVHGYAVVVSETVIEVRCQRGFALLAMAGVSVEIEMRLDDVSGSWFVLHGQVSRIRPASNSLVIAIGALPPQLSTVIANRTGLAGAPQMEVMVVDRDLARRTQVAEAFRAEGCHVVEAGTPRAAIDALGSASRVTDVIAVADTAPESIAIDLRNHLETTYDGALVVAVGEPEWIPSRARLDPSDAQGLLRARVQALLLLRP